MARQLPEWIIMSQAAPGTPFEGNERLYHMESVGLKPSPTMDSAAPPQPLNLNAKQQRAHDLICTRKIAGKLGLAPPRLIVRRTADASFSEEGRLAYAHFNKVIMLKLIMRQRGESEEQQWFKNALLRLREGKSTMADHYRFMEQPRANLDPAMWQSDRNAVCIFTTWAEVDNYHHNQLIALNKPIARIIAVNTGQGAAQADEEDADGLERVVVLGEDACVMLTANLCTPQGLLNGALGTVIAIIYKPDVGLLSCPPQSRLLSDRSLTSATTSAQGPSCP
ncbi:hypothetical protein DFS34DRAFT_646062 [Phlyctochytrium arcticum]|nr:hypothetical protein DFS34DRAFT_646062 [Phlyctochytrium arcticum]